jgi:hypothetical protein
MSSNQFSISYDGPPVDNGTIDARDLAPALLAFAELVDYSAPIIDQQLPRLTVRVRSGFEKGSFEIFLEVASLYDKIVTIFASPDAQAFSVLTTVLGIGYNGSKGLFQLILYARGRSPIKTTKVIVEQKELTNVIFDGEDAIDVENKVWALFQNIDVRKAIEKILSPLNEKGFNLFKIRQHGKENLVVTENDARYFVSPVKREQESISEVETRLIIVAPSFNEGNKWRLSDGTRTIYVSILDNNFIQQINKRVTAFRKGDILHVILRITQWVESEKLCTEYSIVKVIKQDEGTTQEKLLL